MSIGPSQSDLSLIQNAINASNLKDRGAYFNPLYLKFSASNWTAKWIGNRGDTNVSFYVWTPDANVGNFRPLGDFALAGDDVNHFDTKGKVMTVCAGPDDPNALAQPVGFQWICDDKGSGNPNDIAYYWPIAPSGYVAMGVCFGE